MSSTILIHNEQRNRGSSLKMAQNQDALRRLLTGRWVRNFHVAFFRRFALTPRIIAPEAIAAPAVMGHGLCLCPCNNGISTTSQIVEESHQRRMSGITFLIMLAVDIFLILAISQSWAGFVAKKKQIPIMSDYETYSKAYASAITGEPKEQFLLAEYERTQEMLTHYDNLNWQIGSILLGSNIVALGFLSSQSNAQILFAAAFGGSFSLFAWILWFLRHASIYNVKNDRLFMIEQKLSMAQHRMVGLAKENQWLSQFAGNKVAIMLCLGLMVAWLAVLI